MVGLGTWRPSDIEAALAILPRHTSLTEALAELSAAVGVAVSGDALHKALKRRGYGSPSALLRRRGMVPPPRVTAPVPPPEPPPLPSAPPQQPPATDARPISFPSTSRRSDAKRYVLVSDLHIPYESQPAIRAICDFMRDQQPDGIVIAGDALDFYELSRFNRGSVAKMEGRRIVDTFDAGNRVLDQFEAAGGSRLVEKAFLAGNHCARLQKWIETGDNAAFIDDPLVDIPTRLRLQARGWRYDMRYPSGSFKLGKLRVVHGMFCNKHNAATHLEKLQESCVFGHTHVSSMFHGSTWEGQRGAYGLGHLADVSTPAMDYKTTPSNWTMGFGVVHVRPNGDFQFQPLNFVNGVYHYGDRMYGVES
jgi:predicted phosphodiesterase